MKVLLKEDIENIGLAGEVHKVADGYGRNYLLPQGLAVVASPGMMKQAAVWRKKAEARRAELRAEYESLQRTYAAANAPPVFRCAQKQTAHDLVRLARTRASRACCFAISSCSGMCWPRP